LTNRMLAEGCTRIENQIVETPENYPAAVFYGTDSCIETTAPR
jgi:hypothetical protein